MLTAPCIIPYTLVWPCSPCPSFVLPLKCHHFGFTFPVPILLPQQGLGGSQPPPGAAQGVFACRSTLCKASFCFLPSSSLTWVRNLPLISAKPGRCQISSESSALLWWALDKEVRVLLLLATLPKLCFFVCLFLCVSSPSTHSYLWLHGWVAGHKTELCPWYHREQSLLILEQALVQCKFQSGEVGVALKILSVWSEVFAMYLTEIQHYWGQSWGNFPFFKFLLLLFYCCSVAYMVLSTLMCLDT